MGTWSFPLLPTLDRFAALSRSKAQFNLHEHHSHNWIDIFNSLFHSGTPLLSESTELEGVPVRVSDRSFGLVLLFAVLHRISKTNISR